MDEQHALLALLTHSRDRSPLNGPVLIHQGNMDSYVLLDLLPVIASM